jgi:hypothetical protein
LPSHAAPRSFEPRALQPSQRARVAAALAAVAVARRRAWISAGLGRVVAVATAAVAALAIWMLLARAGLLAASTDRAVFAALAALVVVGLVWALAHRLGWLESAQLLDGRGGGRDRLTTALDLAAGGRDDSWAAVQAAEAATLVATLDVSALVPIERPRGLAALITVTVCAGLALFMPVGGWSAAGGGGGATGLALALPEGHAGVVAAADMLSADALELMRADVALLDDVIEQLDAGETRRWLERVRTVLEDVEAGTIDRREALAQLGELEAQRPAPPEQAQAQGTETGEAGASAAQSQTPASRAEAGEDERDRDRAVKKALAKAALEGLDKAPEGQLREALKEAAKQGDLGAMAKVLEKLAEREMSDKELERWVRFAERMAKSLGDRELLKQFEKLAHKAG